MKNINNKVKTCLWMGFCILGLFTSCSSDPDDNGSSFHPDYKKLEVFVDSSANVKVYSVLANRNFVGSSDAGLVGYVQDPVFGEYKTSMIGIASPIDYKFSFEDSVVVKELNLYIKYYTSYGDKGREVPVSVFELIKDSTTNISDLVGMPDDESSITDLWDGNQLLVNTTIPGHGYLIGSSEYGYHTVDLLSTPAGIDLAKRLILTDSVYNESEEYNNISLLHEHIFKGLYFQADMPTDGSSILYIDDSSHIELGLEIFIYDEDSNSYDKVEETIRLSLSDSGRVNVFDRKYKPQIERNIYDTLYEPSLSELDTVFYIHGLHGITGRVVVSELDSIFDYADYLTVNRAELLLTIADSSAYDVAQFPSVKTLRVNVNGESSEMEYLGNVSNYYGEYSIDLTSHMNNQLKSGIKEFVLDLEPDDSEVTPNRVVLRGVNNSNVTVQLKMTYTKFNIN